jgi:beta-glucanase (GH16 family)
MSRSLTLIVAAYSALTLAGCGSTPGLETPPESQSQRLSLPGVRFQTLLGNQYLSALNNGGSSVSATATVAQAWENLALVDVNGGTLESGDLVFVQAGNGQFFQAPNGGGSTLNAGSSNQLGWETFKLVKQSGTGTVVSGDVVGLQTSSGSWVSAQDGGGGPVFAYGGALGSWEQLKFSRVSVESTPPQPLPPKPEPPRNDPTTVANVSFRTTLRGSFLGAQNNGGGAVTANATGAQAWETFSLVDANGGTLESGDSVFLRAGNSQYLQALNGGGSSVNAASNDRLGSETFKLVKQSGSGTIVSGDVVGLQAASGAWLSAENGGGGAVFAYGGALGSWESFTLLTTGAGAAGTSQPPGWRLVWSDEFDGGRIDGSKWNVDVRASGWVNHELQSYTSRAENARVENGHLVIEGRSDWYQGPQYSSGRLTSAGHASFTYGRVEARIQVPGGWGTWPAFWMMPDDFSRGWPACGEIDIMEEVGFDQDSIHATTHSLAYNWQSPNQRTTATNVAGVTAGYHVYAIEWLPDRVDFFVDDRKYYTSPNDNTGDDAWPFHKNFYVVLNLAIGGDWGGARGVDPNIWPRQMLVDYVRVYQH